MYSIDYNRGIINTGDTSRIKKTMAKALKGEAVTLGFLGGSITQGCNATKHENSYTYLVYEWWKNKFPKSDITYVNAGIGGTPSDFGVARVDEDLFYAHPDFTIVEFSVNDMSTFYYMETYEGLVRHVLGTDTALMLFHTICYDNMESAEDKHVIIGKYYDVPEVSVKYTIYPEVANGSIDGLDITTDKLHPNDVGHKMYASQVISLLEKIYETVSEKDADLVISKELKKPLTPNGYENSLRLRNKNFEPVLSGFVADNTPQNQLTEMFRYGYTAWKAGDYLEYEALCSSVSVQYRKSVNKPTPIAIAVIDDDEKNAVILDGNFDQDWGDCLYTQPVLIHGEVKKHKIKISILEDHSNDAITDVVPFYLVSIIIAK